VIRGANPHKNGYDKRGLFAPANLSARLKVDETGNAFLSIPEAVSGSLFKVQYTDALEENSWTDLGGNFPGEEFNLKIELDVALETERPWHRVDMIP